LSYNYRTYKREFKTPDGKSWTFTYRGLTSSETTRLYSIEGEIKRQDFIISKAVFEQDLIANIPDGVKEALTIAVIKASALGEDSPVRKKANEWIESLKGKLEFLIIRMFPTVSLEYLDNCDPLIYEKYKICAMASAPSAGIDLEEYFGIEKGEKSAQDRAIAERKPREITEEERSSMLKNMKFK